MFRTSCILCAWLRRAIGRADPMWMQATDQLRSELLYGEWNTDAFFKADADPPRLRELAEMWDTNPSEAFPHFLALAEEGSVWSMIRVGCGYSIGLGVVRDVNRAEHWFTAAFEAGSDYGLIWGARLARNRGDLAKSMRILEAGDARGLVQATVDLAEIILDKAKTTEDRERARSLYEDAIAKGFLLARGELALSMATGSFGWKAIPEGVRRLREYAKTSGALIKAKKRDLLASAEIRMQQESSKLASPETLRSKTATGG